MILAKISNLIKITEDIYLKSLAHATDAAATDAAAAATRHIEAIKQFGRNLRTGWLAGTIDRIDRGEAGKIIRNVGRVSAPLGVGAVGYKVYSDGKENGNNERIKAHAKTGLNYTYTKGKELATKGSNYINKLREEGNN
jgi:hypothetical protein